MDTTVSALAGSSAHAHSRVSLAAADYVDRRTAGANPIQLEANAARLRSAEAVAVNADATLASREEFIASGVVV